MNPRFHIDGTMPDGSLHGFPCAKAPFAVFDDASQYWLVKGLPYRWMARLIAWIWEQRVARQERSGIKRKLKTASRLMPNQVLKA